MICEPATHRKKGGKGISLSKKRRIVGPSDAWPMRANARGKGKTSPLIVRGKNETFNAGKRREKGEGSSNRAETKTEERTPGGGKGERVDYGVLLGRVRTIVKGKRCVPAKPGGKGKSQIAGIRERSARTLKRGMT